MTSPDPSTLEPELRAISDTFLVQLDRLAALEDRKRVTPVDDPAFPLLAQEVEDATRALLERAAQQTTTATALHDVAVSDGTSGTIEDIPPDYSAARILALWRDTERALAQEEPGSAAAADLERRASAYRAGLPARLRHGAQDAAVERSTRTDPPPAHSSSMGTASSDRRMVRTPSRRLTSRRPPMATTSAFAAASQRRPPGATSTSPRSTSSPCAFGPMGTRADRRHDAVAVALDRQSHHGADGRHADRVTTKVGQGVLQGGGVGHGRGDIGGPIDDHDGGRMLRKQRDRDVSATRWTSTGSVRSGPAVASAERQEVLEEAHQARGIVSHRGHQVATLPP